MRSSNQLSPHTVANFNSDSLNSPPLCYCFFSYQSTAVWLLLSVTLFIRWNTFPRWKIGTKDAGGEDKPGHFRLNNRLHQGGRFSLVTSVSYVQVCRSRFFLATLSDIRHSERHRKPFNGGEGLPLWGLHYRPSAPPHFPSHDVFHLPAFSCLCTLPGERVAFPSPSPPPSLTHHQRRDQTTSNLRLPPGLNLKCISDEAQWAHGKSCCCCHLAWRRINYTWRDYCRFIRSALASGHCGAEFNVKRSILFIYLFFVDNCSSYLMLWMVFNGGNHVDCSFVYLIGLFK